MKNNLLTMRTSFLRKIATTVLLLVFGLFINNVKAQAPSVTITVLPVPTVSVVQPSAICPTQATAGATTASYTVQDAPAMGILGTVTATNSNEIKYYEDNAYVTEITFPLTITATNAQVTKTIYVRARNTANTCTPADASFNIILNPFPNLTITGPNTPCATTGAQYSITGTGLTDISWTSTAGTVINAGTATATIDWTGVSGAQTVTVSYKTAGNCTFTATYAVTPNVLPTVAVKASVTASDLALCSDETVDLNSFVEGTNAVDFEFSTDPDFQTFISSADEVTYAPTGASTLIYVRAVSAATCYSSPITITLTKYNVLNVALGITNTNTTSTDVNYEECSSDLTNANNTLYLTVKPSGGCPNATSYDVVLTIPAGITLGGVTGGNVTVNVLASELTNGKVVSLVVAPNTVSYNIPVVSVATVGGTDCKTCTRTTW